MQGNKIAKNTNLFPAQGRKAIAHTILQTKENKHSGLVLKDNRNEKNIQLAKKINLYQHNTIQRVVGWQISDSRETRREKALVTGNVERASQEGRPLHDARNIYRDENPERGMRDEGIGLEANEVLHIHGHGRPEGVAGLSEGTFTNVLTTKFTIATIKGCTIIFHSCEVGAGGFLTNVLTRLMRSNPGGWNGTTLLAPLRVMLIDKMGVPIVANEDYNDDEVLGDPRRRRQPGVLEKKGHGWAGVQVIRNQITQLTPQQIIPLIKKNT